MKKALVLSGGGARGAYQSGVYKFLTENKFFPDIISGTSVGAINAAAIGSGMDAEALVGLWRSIDSERVMKYSYSRILSDFALGRFTPLADPGPLESLLKSSINFNSLNENKRQKVIITAVNIKDAGLVYFQNKEITIDHLMASSAIPMFFPWRTIAGESYWDGGLMANIPLLPAVEYGAKFIIAVIMTPVGNYNMSLPKTKKQALERIFELFLIGSYQNIRTSLNHQVFSDKKIHVFLDYMCQAYRNVNIITVSPRNSFGFESLLNFSAKQANMLVDRGYQDAKEQLSDVFPLAGKS